MAAVLIVQSDLITAHDMADLLTSEGHTVVGIALSFSRAEEMAGSAELALIEYRLAGTIDGVTLARYLRRHGIKVIYVTASADEVRRKDEGAEIVSKPYSEDALLDAVDRVMSVHG